MYIYICIQTEKNRERERERERENKPTNLPVQPAYYFLDSRSQHPSHAFCQHSDGTPEHAPLKLTCCDHFGQWWWSGGQAALNLSLTPPIWQHRSDCGEGQCSGEPRCLRGLQGLTPTNTQIPTYACRLAGPRFLIALLRLEMVKENQKSDLQKLLPIFSRTQRTRILHQDNDRKIR